MTGIVHAGEPGLELIEGLDGLIFLALERNFSNNVRARGGERNRRAFEARGFVLLGCAAPSAVNNKLRAENQQLSDQIQSLTRDRDEFATLRRRQDRQEIEGLGGRLALKLAPLLGGFVEQPHDLRVIRLRLGDLLTDRRDHLHCLTLRCIRELGFANDGLS